MSRDNQSTPNVSTMLGGVNMLGLAAISAYTIRNLNEIYAYLEEVKEELHKIKASSSESSKRSGNAISRLNDKINQLQQKEAFKFTSPDPKPSSYVPQQPPGLVSKIEVLDDDEPSDDVDDVTSAIRDLMG